MITIMLDIAHLWQHYLKIATHNKRENEGVDEKLCDKTTYTKKGCFYAQVCAVRMPHFHHICIWLGENKISTRGFHQQMRNIRNVSGRTHQQLLFQRRRINIQQCISIQILYLVAHSRAVDAFFLIWFWCCGWNNLLMKSAVRAFILTHTYICVHNVILFYVCILFGLWLSISLHDGRPFAHYSTTLFFSIWMPIFSTDFI